MSSPSERAVRHFVRRSTTVRIATVSPAGNPNIIPLWFVPFRGRFYMSTRSANPIARDLMRKPEIVLLLHGEGSRHQGHVLRLRGRARFRTDEKASLIVALFGAVRYLLPPGAIWNTLVNRRAFAANLRYKGERAGESGVIEFIPESAEFVRLPAVG